MSLKKTISLILIFSIIMSSFMAISFADELDGELLENNLLDGETVIEENVDKEFLDDEFVGGVTDYVTPDDVTVVDTEEKNFLAEGNPYSRPVNVLSALGIMQGKSNNDFALNDFLTKAEMCTIAMRFLGIKTAPSSHKKSAFLDVDNSHWAKGYIDVAFDMELVNGNGAGMFSPDDRLTAEQAIKIIVCALGYEPKAQAEGGYPMGYVLVASELGLLKGVNLANGYSGYIARGEIATIVYNALEVDLMEVKLNGDGDSSAVLNDVNALGQYHRVERKDGIVEGAYQASFDNKDLEEGEVVIDDVKYITSLDMRKYLGIRVEFYCTIVNASGKSEILLAFSGIDKADAVTITFEDINSVNVNADFDVEVKYYSEKTNKLKSLDLKRPIIMYNGIEETFDTTAELQSLFDNHMEQGQIRYINHTKSGYRDVIFVENYNAYVLERTDAENDRIYYYNYLPTGYDIGMLDMALSEDNGGKVFYYDEDGEPTNIAGLAPNSAIMVYESLDKSIYSIYACDNEVSGVIESAKKVETAKEVISNEKPYEKLIDIDINDPVVTHAINGSDGNWNYTGYATTSDGETYDVCGYPAWGRLNVDTGYKEISELPDSVKDVPENTGNNVFYLSRHRQGWNNNRYPVNASGMKISGDFSNIKAGDRIRISTWVYTDNVKGYISGSTDPIEIEDQESVTSCINIQIDRPLKRTAMSVVDANVPNRIWTKVSAEFDIKYDDDIASITISCGGTNYAWDTYYNGITVERVSSGDEVEIVPTYDIYEFCIDGKEYENVNTLDTTRLKLGEEIFLVLDNNNRIVGYKTENENSNYGILMDVAISDDAFGSHLLVKILEEDGVIRTYETREEIKAYNGTRVTKVLAKSLVTDIPIDIKKDYYLWSTNNAENFVQSNRTWLSDKQKSITACRKMVYYEIGSDGLIRTILVPSIPETDKDCKLTLVHNYNDGDLSHAIAGRWFVHKKGSGREDLVHYIDNNAKVFEAFPMNYEESDYSALPYNMTSISEANLINGMEWSLAQLYKYPGSEKINFVVINPSSPYNNELETVLVEGLTKTIDGYSLKGYINGELFKMPIKDGTRLMENIWVSDLDRNKGKIITSEDLPDLAIMNVKPYNVAYESDFMGNRENPYIDNNSLKKGDIVEILVRDGEIVYLAVVRRIDTGIFSKYSVSDATGNLYSFMRATSAVRGEVVDIDLDINIVSVKGYYWPGTVAVPGLEEYSQSASPITELTSIISVANTAPVVYDQKEDVCYLGTTADFEVGDEIISYAYSGLPSYVFIFKK